MVEDVEYDELEFAYRQYVVACEYMLDVFARLEEESDSGTSERIRRALMALAVAVEDEWG